MFAWTKKVGHRVRLEGGVEISTQPGETVLNAALRSGVAFPFSCKVGGCGSCKCQLLEGKVKELTDKSYLLTREELQQNYILGCQSVPRSDLRLRIPQDPLTQQQVQGCIRASTALSHDIVELRVDLDAPLRYRPGQYAIVSVEGSALPPRCYSFAQASDEAEGARQIRFFVRRLPGGGLSQLLCAPEALGRRLQLSASHGQFHLREGSTPLLCIAGGSGLAPLLALLQGALHSGAAFREVTLLFGVRAQRDLYCQNEIAALAQRWQGRFHFMPVLSEEPADSSWQGLRGLVTEHLSAPLAAGAQAYLCGPPAMIDAAMSRLAALGMPREQMFFDKFSDQSQTAKAA